MKLNSAFPIGLICLVIGGVVYEEAGKRVDRARLRQIGRSVDIGGRSLNIFCSGHGTPTVVFDSGRGMPGYSWLRVQPEIARDTRACWYDRAGYGWSDPAPAPHRSDAIAEDLHRLLRAAGEAAPFVLVGHSFGGLNVRMYYERYPADVAGMVLVDPSDEDFEDIPHPPLVSPALLMPEILVPAEMLVARMMGPIGVFRLLAPAPGAPFDGIPADVWTDLAVLQSQSKAQIASIQEGPEWADFALLRRAGSLRDLPLIILIAGKSSVGTESEDLTAFQQMRIEVFGNLAHRSTRGRHVVVTNSGHFMPYETPEAVIMAIREIMVEVRRSHD